MLRTLEDRLKRLWIWVSLSIGRPLGNLEGGSSIRDFERWMKGGSRNGAFLSEEAQCGGPLGRVHLLGTLEDMLRKVLDTGISLHRGAVGEPGGDSLAGTF